MGFFSNLKDIVTDPVRLVTDVATGGLAEFTKKDPFGVPNGQSYLPIAAGAGMGAMFGNPMAGAQIGMGIYGSQQTAEAQRQANEMNIQLAHEQMAFSAMQAQNQMEFQERMSSTAVQRMQQDMLAAGINPMLAAGQGESTPGGAMGSYSPATVSPVPSAVVNSLNSAQGSIRLLQDLKESNSRISANRAAARQSNMTAEEKQADAYIEGLKKWLLEKVVGTAKDVKKSFSGPGPVYKEPPPALEWVH